MPGKISDVLQSAAAIAKGMSVTFKEMMQPTRDGGLSRRSAEISGAVSRRARAAAR